MPVLFQHSLREVEDQSVTNLNHIFSVEPMKISSPATDAEVALALRVLEGCCLFHRESTILAHQHKAITVREWKLVLYRPNHSFISWNLSECFNLLASIHLLCSLTILDAFANAKILLPLMFGRS